MPGTGSHDELARIGQNKAFWRGVVREQLQKLTPAERARDSHLACARLRQLEVWLEASSVLFYAPLPDELDISCLVSEALSAGKAVALPRFDSQSGTYQACPI